MRIRMALAMGAVIVGLAAWHLDPIFATTQTPIGNPALAAAIQELKQDIQRLESELKALKQNGVAILPMPGRIPRVPQSETRPYPWEPYYDGFAFEPKAHFITDAK